MKKEMSYSDRDKLAKKILYGGCAFLIISMVGGYMYYQNYLDNTLGKQVREEMLKSQTTCPETTFDWEAITISDKDNKILDANTIVEEVVETKDNIVDTVKNTVGGIFTSISNKTTDTVNTGYDKNGNPYLVKGKSYTFKADGTPVEAPTNGDTAYVTSTNGKTYMYSGSKQIWVDKAIIDNQVAQAQAEAKGEIDGLGDTDVRHLTGEEISAVGKWNVNLGSMGY